MMLETYLNKCLTEVSTFSFLDVCRLLARRFLFFFSLVVTTHA